jgi:SEC-C motif-containing protein
MPCTCGNPGSFEECCAPILAGTRPAPTAVALMRARYSAYAHGNIDFVFDSLAPESRHDFDRPSAEQWSRQSKWLGLEVVRTERGGPGDRDGVVEFIARFEVQGQAVEHHEVATFRNDEGRWLFVDGQLRKQEPFRRAAPKVGANDPCPCGSGKKWKKCCGRRSAAG